MSCPNNNNDNTLTENKAAETDVATKPKETTPPSDLDLQNTTKGSGIEVEKAPK